MKRNSLIGRMALVLLGVALVGTAIAWQDQPGKFAGANATDTVPSKKVKDIDQAIEELEKSRIELEKTLKNRDWEKDIQASMKEFDGEKIKAEIEKALKEVDAVKIQADVEKALKSIDLQKMQAELSEALKEIDGEKIRADIQKALKEVDAQRIKADIEMSLAKVDMEKVKAEMQRIKEVDFKKIEEDMKKMGPEIEKSMAEARKSMEQAKAELTAYKGFIDDLHQQGLIDKKKDYTIQYKNGELTINGKKQPESLVKKFSSFLKDRKDFTISKDAGDFNIDND